VSDEDVLHSKLASAPRRGDGLHGE
jgi:hypothetical protein